jgi:hypothetical protein
MNNLSRLHFPNNDTDERWDCHRIHGNGSRTERCGSVDGDQIRAVWLQPSVLSSHPLVAPQRGPDRIKQKDCVRTGVARRGGSEFSFALGGYIMATNWQEVKPDTPLSELTVGDLIEAIGWALAQYRPGQSGDVEGFVFGGGTQPTMLAPKANQVALMGWKETGQWGQWNSNFWGVTPQRR